MKLEHPFFQNSVEVIFTEKGVKEISFRKKKFSNQKKSRHPMAKKIIQSLENYLGGGGFLDLPIDWQSIPATSFQKRVWKKMQQIPHGQLKTYGELARSIRAPGAARAVGTACAKNPILLVIPCHRVVAANGDGGFSGGGLAIKKKLHVLEGCSRNHKL